MTLGENKKIALALIEEYAPNNQYLTDDEDIRDRMNLIYAHCQVICINQKEYSH